VRYAETAVRAAAELAAKYVNDRFLPDKAIDVLDESGARNRLRPDGERKSTLEALDIEQVVAKLAKIPEQPVSLDDRDQLAGLDGRLCGLIYGQQAAVQTAVSSIKRARAGLGVNGRPIGSFLFSGPTGVGKTELAKQLAQALGVEFLRFDMTEYMEKHAVSRLIGAPPGYVGFDQGGCSRTPCARPPTPCCCWTRSKRPTSDLFNLLLQIMDHATCTDNDGRKADLRHVILIFTTNAGARDLTSRSLGFTQAAVAPSTRELSRGAIERTFSPEFRNRLDGWIAVEPLGLDAIRRVVDKLVAQLAAQLAQKQVVLVLEESARDWLADKGLDPVFGARPMARTLLEQITGRLADAILFGALRAGGSVRVHVEAGELVLTSAARETAAS
jgi:ATP-dependent Clp protease ATP-binding subunit ClpA